MVPWGLDAARIRRKAVDSGLVTESEASSMADASVFRFILRPGFSTAAEVTAISGRGVGMDVVRSNIERIGGAIDIESQAGRGSTFIIKIPLTLAIVPALIVGCAGERFAIPQISVVELVRASKSGEHRIEQISDSAVLRLRERLLPLIDLRVVLGLDADEGADDERLIIVTQVGASYFGIIVDRVHDTEEIVVKPVSPLLKSLTVYSGNTILGDGSICMIIDPNGMISRIGRIDLASVAQDSNDLPSNSRIAADENQRLLLVKAGDGMNKAIPLDQIARLEDIDVESIRRSDDGRLLVPYRGSLMPLIHAASGGELKMSGRQPVLVFVEKNTTTSKPRQLGLIVDQIIDIIEHTARVDIESGNPDVIGSAIVAGEPMEILNTEGLMRREFAGWNGMADLAYAIEGAAR
jgi:two-component system, chemotaxis family, sensor kinase CheA